MQLTTEQYWDCECDEDYIHHAGQVECPKCGAVSFESPDAHVNEVIEQLELTRAELLELLIEVSEQ